MSNRSWFFASQGKQQGPYPEAQLRAFIANGTVTAETLVWSEDMAGWQRAEDIPGLLAGASGLPPVPQRGGLSANRRCRGRPVALGRFQHLGAARARTAFSDRFPAGDSGALDGDEFLSLVHRTPAGTAAA